MFYVYLHTTPEGKFYVGETKRVLERWSNGDGYTENKEFHNAIELYGWHSIKHEIVMECATETEARIYEALLMFSLNSENVECGYNKTTYRANILEAYAKRRPLERISLTNDNPDTSIFECSGLPISACEQIINQWIFNKRHREIIHDKLIDAMSYKDMASKYSLSERQLKSIVSDCTHILSEHL